MHLKNKDEMQAYTLTNHVSSVHQAKFSSEKLNTIKELLAKPW